MKKMLLLFSSFLFLLTANVFAQNTTLQGKVLDEATGEPIIGGNVKLYKEQVFITGTATDFDGNYTFSNLDPANYTVEFSYVGYGDKSITDYRVVVGTSNLLSINLSEGVDLPVTIVYGKLITADVTSTGDVFDAKDIENAGTLDLTDIVKLTPGATASDDGEAITIKMGLPEGVAYVLDGIRVNRSDIPVQDLEQVKVITGGISAAYGDLTSGVVSMTSKGPSLNYTGRVEMETSEPFNNYGFNQLRANISGPIIKKQLSENRQTSLLGFRLSGQYRVRADDDPSALPIYSIKDDVLAGLEADPVEERIVNGVVSYLPSAQNLTNEDMQVLNYRPNEKEVSTNLTAVLEARPSKNIDLRLIGTFSDEEDQFTPGYGSSQTATDRNRYAAWRGTWTALNSKYNPYTNRNRYNGILKMRHKLGVQEFDPDDPTKVLESKSAIQNASYDISLSYEKTTQSTADQRHGDNLFAYGHIGTFDYEWIPVLGSTDFDTQERHLDYRKEFTGYQAGNSNPVLGNYNKLFQDSENENDFLLINGDYSSGVVHEVWGLHENVGTVYNSFSKRDNDFYTFKVNSTFDLIPNGEVDKGRHSIQFGINYEQRFLRGYDIRPNALWLTARGLVDRHLTGVDTEKIVGSFTDPNTGLIYDQYAPLNNEEEFDGSYFYKRVRALDGTSVNEFFNIDKLSPEQMSLDLFSAQELMDDTRLGLDFYGYDYKGDKLSNNVTFDDFFTSVDENGVRDHPIAAFKPIYSAAYIQDKFTYKDIILNLGVRVDRYDANTKVLKDPYSLYEGMSAEDFYALDETSDLVRPQGVEDDFIVYVSGDDRSTDVSAFRSGDQWYFPDGSAANGGNVVFGGEVVNPKKYQERNNKIRSQGFDINNSFTDYKPQVNWMPRLGFSFPISDQANFFAHYDVLVQRPLSTQARATPLQYFYMEERSASTLFQNPNLKPQRTVDYELGFQQMLTKNSMLKVTAHYREMRDMVQRRTYTFVANPVGRYTTFDNQDFGTVKGMTFQYKYKSGKNLDFNGSYTLQFADGTGSDANSQAGIGSRGSIRNLYPMNRDERHNRLICRCPVRSCSSGQAQNFQLNSVDYTPERWVLEFSELPAIWKKMRGVKRASTNGSAFHRHSPSLLPGNGKLPIIKHGSTFQLTASSHSQALPPRAWGLPCYLFLSATKRLSSSECLSFHAAPSPTYGSQLTRSFDNKRILKRCWSSLQKPSEPMRN